MSFTKIQGIQIPSIFSYFIASFRASFMGCPISFLKQRKDNLGKGDGHPVVVIPGYMDGGRSIKMLNRFLKKEGYQAQTWDLSTDIFKSKNYRRLSDQVEKLYTEAGQPITIIGWSLGGMYARLLATKFPEKIRQIILIATPFNGINTLGNAEWWFSLVYRGAKVGEISKELLDKLAKPIAIPTTCIYSKDDKLVAWETCIESVEDEAHQNIEVSGDHIQLVFDKEVLPIILDRLTFQKENWERLETVDWLPLPYAKVN